MPLGAEGHPAAAKTWVVVALLIGGPPLAGSVSVLLCVSELPADTRCYSQSLDQALAPLRLESFGIRSGDWRCR
jgi:hypothetical protein